MILGLFSQKNLKINIDRELYWIVHFYLDFFCASSEWYSNNQNYEVKQGEQGRVENIFLQTPKSKIDKNHSYAIFPYKNNNHIFYDYSEINQKGPPIRKMWLKWTKNVFFTQRHMLRFVQIRNNHYENRLIFLLLANKNIVFP
jgi:hypothetical protein